MRVLLAVAGASALGGLARHLANVVVAGRGAGFPWATFLVNVSGAFAVGLAVALLGGRLRAPEWLEVALLVGFLGSYTTFSTWTLESYRLLEQGATGPALANLLGSMTFGVLATFAGVVVGRAL